MIIRRPFDELELPDKNRLQPNAIAHLLRREPASCFAQENQCCQQPPHERFRYPGRTKVTWCYTGPRMKGRFLHAGLLQFALLVTSSSAQDPGKHQGWMRFRGPNGSGISPDTGFPIEFGKSRNVIWRSPVRPGKSSPVLTERNVFLTGYDKERLITQCFDRATGRLLWERVEMRAHKQDVNCLNNPAAITPVSALLKQH